MFISKASDQFLMNLHPKFEVTHSNLMNLNPSTYLDVCFQELLCKEQHLLTQATLEQDSDLNLVSYVAYDREKGNLHKVQYFNCKEYGHIRPIVQSKCVTTVRNKSLYQRTSHSAFKSSSYRQSNYVNTSSTQ